MRETDRYFDHKDEPLKGVLLALRQLILSAHPDIQETWKYKVPMYSFNGKNLCYLSFDKKSKQPYIGFVKGKHMEHPLLYAGHRTQIKIVCIDPNEDIPVHPIRELLSVALNLNIL